MRLEHEIGHEIGDDWRQIGDEHDWRRFLGNEIGYVLRLTVKSHKKWL